MLNQCAETVLPVAAPSVTLRRLWTVDADARYDISGSRRADGFIVVRTHAGLGRIWCDGDPAIDLPAGSVFVTGPERVRRYRCVDTRWAFHWAECAPGGCPLPMGALLPVPLAPDEAALYAEMSLRLRGHPETDPALASATLGWLLQRWAATGRRHRAAEPDRAVEDLLSRIHAAIDAGIPPVLDRLRAGIPYGERRLRDLFRAAIGRSPKRYLDDLRLQRAAALLDQGQSVRATAAALGFSSPFHLSRAYRSHYGRPPSMPAKWPGNSSLRKDGWDHS